MTEKQRWLLRELESWREAQLAKVGKYSAKTTPKEPAKVRAAKKARARASVVINKWEVEKSAVWNRQKGAISKQFENVRRVILFEKTDAALKAVNGLLR